VTISYDGALALLGALITAVVPLPHRAEGLRIGLFSAVLAFLLFSARDRRTATQAYATPELQAQPDTHVERLLSDSDDRLDAGQLLTDFSILRHLRRLGAVSEREFEAKKADILRRV
jgi:hypothetical protein